MPSSIASGPKFRSIRGGGKYRIAPDFLQTVSFAAASVSGANTGFVVFTVPQDVRGAIFLGVTGVHSTAAAAADEARVQKLEDDAAPGDASGTDLTAAIALDATANVPYDAEAITTDAVNVLNPGDRVAIASTDGVATLAGAVWHLRFAWL